MDAIASSIMQEIVFPVSMDDTVADVETQMKSRHVSSAPVYDANGAVLGIITSTDLLRFHAQQRDPHASRAWEICSYQPAEVKPDTPLALVARMMLDRQVHHVVVMEDDSMKGIISALDFVRLYADRV